MKLEEALGLVEEVRNCSLPWDDAHWEALGIVIDYVKNKSQKQWKPSEEQLKALNTMNVTGCITEVGQGKSLVELYNDIKKLREE